MDLKNLLLSEIQLIHTNNILNLSRKFVFRAFDNYLVIKRNSNGK